MALIKEDTFRIKIEDLVAKNMKEVLGLPCHGKLSVFFFRTSRSYILNIYHEDFGEGVNYILHREYSLSKGEGYIMAEIKKDMLELLNMIYFLETMYAIKLDESYGLKYLTFSRLEGVSGVYGIFVSETLENLVYFRSYAKSGFTKIGGK